VLTADYSESRDRPPTLRPQHMTRLSTVDDDDDNNDNNDDDC